MTRTVQRRRQTSGRGRSWPATLAAVAVFGLLATMPLTLALLHVHLTPVAATTSHGVKLLPAPSAPAAVVLPPSAQPVSAGEPPAALPAVDAAREAAAVTAEDRRIRTLLHDAVHIFQPQVIPIRAALPTLVLTAISRPYTAADLVQYGALVMLPHNSAILLDNVFVSTNATLSLGGTALRTLYLDSGSGGFTSIVAWGGSLAFHGTAKYPFTIMGWDRADSSPAADKGFGRPYLREVGGSMTITDARVSSLGFWSGRTGGVAWTGITGKPSTGGATRSTFTDDTYGAFVARSSGVTFRGDLFEFNELDGLRVHRYSTGTRVLSSAAARNGGNGFIVSRATKDTVLRGDLSQNNGYNGFYVDGRPLVNGASASGGSATPGSGAEILSSEATGNGRLGILVEGGSGTVVEGNEVCATITAIALRYNASGAVLTGNDIRCGPRTGFSVGPATADTTISGNTVTGARMGILVRDAGSVQVDNNRIFGATVFGITARGASSKVSGVGNVLSGTGFRAVDARADAAPPALSSTDLSGWVHHVKITFWSYLRFHPLAALWLSIVVLVVLAAVWSRRKRLPAHPYAASTHWRDGLRTEMPPVPDAAAKARASKPAPQPTPDTWPPLPVSVHNGAGDSHGTPQTAPRPEPAAMPLPAFEPAPTRTAPMPVLTLVGPIGKPPWAEEEEEDEGEPPMSNGFDVFAPKRKEDETW
ncbi:MAG TPA: right-handed parallel beta-helix repeat-containing protein [Streptosporangiaceae bacterium]|nr:right-handed parallel beta-helix repeat-containing protein [Streptosporangiaceae bacterium]